MSPFGSDAALVHRSRYGDRGATQRLLARHHARVQQLATAVAPEQPQSVAQQGFSLALRGKRPFDDALVTAFGRLAAAVPGAQQRLLAELVEERPLEQAAALVGLSPDVARAVLQVPTELSPRHCRGWGLVARRDRLTLDEQEAADAHLVLCRRCRDRQARLALVRAQAVGGAVLAGAALAATTQALSSGSASGAGVGASGAAAGTAGPVGLLGGKAALALVGVAASGVLATGSATVAHQQRVPPPRVATTPTSTASPSAAVRVPALDTPVVVPDLLRRQVEEAPSVVVPDVLPTGLLPSAVPLPVPSEVPLPLPSELPLPVPTGLLPVPLPTSVRLPTAVPLPTSLPLR